MGFPINGDLVPSVSGFANLGVDVSSNGQNAFDITSLRPFNHVHMISGVYHDPIMGQSGVIRFNQQDACFEASIDGGITFNCITTDATAGGVTSLGVLGDANLTGAIDLASPASGFIAIEDTANASPLLFSIDVLGLSGLWDFPSQGFNGSIVNSLTDFNGTEAQGTISVVGASGVIVDIVGQTMTIATNVDTSNVARCYVETFTSAASWTVNHGLNTTDVSVSVYNDDSPALEIMPDMIEITDANNVTISHNVAQAGKVIVLGC